MFGNAGLSVASPCKPFAYRTVSVLFLMWLWYTPPVMFRLCSAVRSGHRTGDGLDEGRGMARPARKDGEQWVANNHAETPSHVFLERTRRRGFVITHGARLTKARVQRMVELAR